MKIRIKNARILTMKQEEDIFEGEIDIEDTCISYVGPPRQNMSEDNIKWSRVIDAEHNLIMPGFKNAHTHSGMTFLRSFADDLPLQEWLTQQVFPMEAELSGNDIYELSRLAILEYLTSGITANFDMYEAPYDIARAAVDCGFRTVQCGGVNGQTIEELEDWYLHLNPEKGLVSFLLGFHAEYTNSREMLEQIADLAEKYHAPVWAHISETRREVEECIGRWGMTPVAFLNSLGLFRYGGGGYHCVYVTEEDIRILAEHNCSVVTNPGSNMKLASGIAPIQKFLAAGVNLAIGTDGPASNNALDMFREMYLTAGLAKLREKDAAAVNAFEVLKMATAGGAKAMGLTDCDVLDVGKQADLIMIDLKQPNMQPIHNICKNLVYSGSKTNVAMTMVAGKILYERGRFFVGEDPQSIYAKCNEITERIKHRVHRES